MLKRIVLAAAGCTSLICGSLPASGADGVVRVYADRFNEQLAEAFTQSTGIEVEIVKGEAAEMVEGILAEGQEVADVVIGGNLASLVRLQESGVFERLDSSVIKEKIPETLREPDGQWFATFRRARVIYYNPDMVPEAPTAYADLAGPDYDGKVCVGSGMSGYNQAFISALIETAGSDAAEEFVRGYVANDANAPEGHDPVQILNVGSGACAVAIANHYYFLNLKAEDKPENREALAKVKVAWPDAASGGVFANNGGAGLAKNAANREGAVAFLEYLASDEAQKMFAGRAFFAAGNVDPSEAVQELGTPAWSPLNVAASASNIAEARAMIEAAGWPSPPPRRPR